MRWTALDPDDRSYEFVTESARARTGSDVLEAARTLHSPTQNIVYADNDGLIGFVAAGRVPVRRADNELHGLIPALGWEPRYEWQGYLPFEQLPRRQSPPSGRLVTANQKIAPDGYPYWLGAEWTDPARAQRIQTLLDGVERHSVESFGRIQADLHDGTARMLLPSLLVGLHDGLHSEGGARVSPSMGSGTLDHRSDTGRVALASASAACGKLDAALLRAAVERIEHWDLEMQHDRPEPLIFSAWVRELSREVYADELESDFRDYWAERPVFLANVLADWRGQARWCDDVHTPEPEPCSPLVLRALCLGLSVLNERYGDDLDAWRWGDAHVARSRHVPLTEVPLLRRWFDIVTPSPGGSHTVNAGAFAIDDDDLFENRHAASFRAIYDLGDVQRSTFLLRTGQSGHVLSPHYRNWTQPWLDGAAVTMSTRRETFERDALGTLRLIPRLP